MAKDTNKYIEAIRWDKKDTLLEIRKRVLDSWGKDRKVEFSKFAFLVSKFRGKKITVLCAYFWYRGILSEVTPDCVVLSSPNIILSTGTCSGEKPIDEISIQAQIPEQWTGKLVIPITAIEMLARPKFCFAPLEAKKKIFNWATAAGALTSQKDNKIWEGFKKYVVEPYEGNRVAVLCNRYWYRGIVKKATSDCIVLEKGIAVEIAGKPEDAKSKVEDWIGSDVFIPRTTIEMICHPKWCEAPLEPNKTA